ncbi:hypothetical protein [Succinimonas sp.]|uniref:hypothetical protein n=1 Tax=Succinimonas sp. TaxID=1936151 RepID=UPI00386786DC
MIDVLLDAAVAGCGSYILLGILALAVLGILAFILMLCFEFHPLAGVFMSLVFLLLAVSAVRDHMKKSGKEEENSDPDESRQRKEVNPVTQSAVLILALLIVIAIGVIIRFQ